MTTAYDYKQFSKADMDREKIAWVKETILLVQQLQMGEKTEIELLVKLWKTEENITERIAESTGVRNTLLPQLTQTYTEIDKAGQALHAPDGTTEEAKQLLFRTFWTRITHTV